eukprot:5770335-Prymnesium_polylepis.1
MHHRLGTTSRKAIWRPVNWRQRSRRVAASVSHASSHGRWRRGSRERDAARPSGGCAQQGRSRLRPP